jgi:hypothetical protein
VWGDQWSRQRGPASNRTVQHRGLDLCSRVSGPYDPAMFAHAVGGGALPAPPWLLSYIGVALMLGTAATLRATWPTTRHLVDLDLAPPTDPRVGPGNVVGLVLLGAVLGAAIIGPDSGAANIAPVSVLVIWWVGLPLACLLLGDVMRWLSPFPVLAAGPSVPDAPAAPSWTSAAFLAAFGWYFLAYHHPGSPRALAVFLVGYVLVVALASRRWGRAWVVTGEGFGGLSAAVGRIGLRRPRGAAPAGTAALMVVWLGGTGFDAFANTPFWIDVLGTSQGWTRTLLNTVGLVWVTAIVAGAFLLVVWVADRGSEHAPLRQLAAPLGIALVPLTTGWFIAHDLTLLLFEGQNFIALLSDPLGRGWDLFGTFNHTIRYSVVKATWVRVVQLTMLVVGHVAAIVLLHDTALALRRRRPAMQATWTMAVAASASITGAALLVLT